METRQAFTGGLAGALALTITHQLLHRFFDKAPRMDLMGEEGLMKLKTAVGQPAPPKHLYEITMAGDIAGNAVYYAAAGIGDPKNAILRGTALGLAAGIGAVVLPKHIGLTNSYSDRSLATKIMTIGIYTLGGFVSGAVIQRLAKV